MIKKVLCTFLFLGIVFLLTACGSGEVFRRELLVSDLSIDDFVWDTKESKCYSNDCYVVSLTNNSSYDIIGVDFTYKVKDSATDDDLKIFDSFMSKHDSFIKEEASAKNVTLGANENVMVKKGETITGLNLTIGYKNWFWYDYPTEKQFNLMEPNELQVGIISGDKLYIAYYGFQDKTWKIDENKIAIDTWTKNEIGKKLNKPNSEHFVVKTDREDEFSIYAYGVTEDNFSDYVSSLKDSGFIEDPSYSSHFSGTNSEGYTVDVWYYKNKQEMNISIEKEDR